MTTHLNHVSFVFTNKRRFDGVSYFCISFLCDLPQPNRDRPTNSGRVIYAWLARKLRRTMINYCQRSTLTHERLNEKHNLTTHMNELSSEWTGAPLAYVYSKYGWSRL